MISLFVSVRSNVWAICEYNPALRRSRNVQKHSRQTSPWWCPTARTRVLQVAWQKVSDEIECRCGRSSPEESFCPCWNVDSALLMATSLDHQQRLPARACSCAAAHRTAFGWYRWSAGEAAVHLPVASLQRVPKALLVPCKVRYPMTERTVLKSVSWSFGDDWDNCSRFQDK